MSRARDGEAARRCGLERRKRQHVSAVNELGSQDTVAAYFEMLALEARQAAYNKSAFNAELRKRLQAP